MDNKITQDLLIGINNNNNIIIPEKNRPLNLAIIGTKNSGKTTKILPMLAKQQIEDGSNFVGCTFIVNDKEESYHLMAIANRLKKKTQLKVIKPSADIVTYKTLLADNPYDYDEMNALIDYKTEIRNKAIVVIDLEEEKYGEKSKRLLKKILYHLYIDIQNTDITLRRPHYLYIDDADEYISSLENLLKYNETYNLATTLFLSSFTNLRTKDQAIIESFVKNYIVLSNLLTSDIYYFAEKFSYYKEFSSLEEYNLNKIKITKEIILRTPNIIIYNIIDNKGLKQYGKCNLYNNLNDDKENEAILNISKKIKKKMLIPDNNIPLKMGIDKFNEINYPKNIKNEQYEDVTESVQKVSSNIDLGDAILDNIDNIPDLYKDEEENFDITKIVDINTGALDTSKKKKKKKKKKKHSQILNDVSDNVNDGINTNPNINKENVIDSENTDNLDIINEVNDIISDSDVSKDIDDSINPEDSNDIKNIIKDVTENTIANEENQENDINEEINFTDINNESSKEEYLNDEDEDIIINIEHKNESKKSEIDDAFDNSLEKLADAEEENYNDFYPEYIPETAYEIDENNNDKNIKQSDTNLNTSSNNISDDSNKTFFDIDSLFDDDESDEN